jgi:hypothetical protein
LEEDKRFNEIYSEEWVFPLGGDRGLSKISVESRVVRARWAP